MKIKKQDVIYKYNLFYKSIQELKKVLMIFDQLKREYRFHYIGGISDFSLWKEKIHKIIIDFDGKKNKLRGKFERKEQKRNTNRITKMENK